MCVGSWTHGLEAGDAGWGKLGAQVAEPAAEDVEAQGVLW